MQRKNVFSEGRARYCAFTGGPSGLETDPVSPGSAWGPVHPAAAEDMEMDVKDGLPGVGAIIVSA